jgi:hypothetical protein
MSLQSDVNSVKTDVAVLRERFEDMDGKLDKVLTSLHGNGKPGLLVRFDRLERSNSQRS